MKSMQATVLAFDPETGSGSVVLDDGHRLPFTSDVFARSGLRLLRSGQRVRITLSSEQTVTALTIITLADPQ